MISDLYWSPVKQRLAMFRKQEKKTVVGVNLIDLRLLSGLSLP
jgi:hypothetical protein